VQCTENKMPYLHFRRIILRKYSLYRIRPFRASKLQTGNLPRVETPHRIWNMTPRTLRELEMMGKALLRLGCFLILFVSSRLRTARGAGRAQNALTPRHDRVRPSARFSSHCGAKPITLKTDAWRRSRRHRHPTSHQRSSHA